MLANGESQKEVIQPDFNRAIMIDFQGAQISSDTGFILLREIDAFQHQEDTCSDDFPCQDALPGAHGGSCDLYLAEAKKQNDHVE